MADVNYNPDEYPIRMEGTYPGTDLFLIAASVEEGLSQLTRTTIEFTCKNRELDLETIVGTQMRILLEADVHDLRVFPGTCISVEYLGASDGPGHFRAEIRPWLWFLTRTRDCRVFQEKSTVDIIEDVLGGYGFSGDVDNRLSGTYDPRTYIVQYRETDYAFLSRLMEEDGIYFYFVEDGGKEKMVLADGTGAHPAAPGLSVLPFQAVGGAAYVQREHVRDWKSAERVVSGKVTLRDYDFERPTADMMPATVIPKGAHSLNDREIYDHPGHYRTDGMGDTRARVRMEAEAVRHKTASGVATATNLGVGTTFTLEDHPRAVDNAEHMLTRACHRLQLVGTALPPAVVTPLDAEFAALADSNDPYQVAFDAIPATEQFRAPLITPWPEIAGVHTAVVVGPKGEEIHTDKYGRIRVQFHWDRLGKKDEKSSCFVRTMMPWTGNNWGMIAIPRIGQEVVIQFEEGDPDRPMCIGMLYNADRMPPYELPDNMTQSGIKTNTSKDGDGFNELMFEDKKGSELVRFQAERDFEQIIKNNASVTVGLGHKDKGDMEVQIHRHLKETVKTGNHTFTVASGNQTLKIKKDKDETIEGKSDLTVKNDVTETIQMGNITRTVEMGNISETLSMGNIERKLDMGNDVTTLTMGNQTVDASMGKIEYSAMQAIELKCGGSSIKIDPSGVTIKGPMIKVDASAMLELNGTMTKAQAQMLVLKGSLTMIN